MKILTLSPPAQFSPLLPPLRRNGKSFPQSPRPSRGKQAPQAPLQRHTELQRHPSPCGFAGYARRCGNFRRGNAGAGEAGLDTGNFPIEKSS